MPTTADSRKLFKRSDKESSLMIVHAETLGAKAARVQGKKGPNSVASSTDDTGKQDYQSKHRTPDKVSSRCSCDKFCCLWRCFLCAQRDSFVESEKEIGLRRLQQHLLQRSP